LTHRRIIARFGGGSDRFGKEGGGGGGGLLEGGLGLGGGLTLKQFSSGSTSNANYVLGGGNDNKLMYHRRDSKGSIFVYDVNRLVLQEQSTTPKYSDAPILQSTRIRKHFVRPAPVKTIPFY